MRSRILIAFALVALVASGCGSKREGRLAKATAGPSSSPVAASDQEPTPSTAASAAPGADATDAPVSGGRPAAPGTASPNGIAPAVGKYVYAVSGSSTDSSTGKEKPIE